MPFHDDTSFIIWFFIWSIWSPVRPLKSISSAVMEIIVIWWRRHANIRSWMMISEKHLSTQPCLMVSFSDVIFYELVVSQERLAVDQNWPFLLVIVLPVIPSPGHHQPLQMMLGLSRSYLIIHLDLRLPLTILSQSPTQWQTVAVWTTLTVFST